MLTRDANAFLDFARGLDRDFGPATARAAFLVAPDGFALAEQSAADNRYMAAAAAFDAARASAQHRDLHRAFSAVVPTVCFAGDPDTPDALFPNNVFATVAGRYVVGRMRHRGGGLLDRPEGRGETSDPVGPGSLDPRDGPQRCRARGGEGRELR